MNPLTALSLPQLRERRSAKWRTYGPDVLPLWVAEMDTPLAPPVAEALAAAVARGDTGYVWPGALAEAYADFAAARLGWVPDPALALLVPDVMRGIVEVLGAVTERGDGVVVNPPVYPPFFSYLRDAQRRVVRVPLAEAGGGVYRLDLAGLEAAFAAGARAYLLCNPHNPTGTVFSREDLLAVAALAHRYGVRLLADEIHAPLAYPGTAAVPLLSLATEAEAAARGFVFGSTSKSWNLPGLKAALVFAGPAAGADLRVIPPDVPLSAGLLGVVAGEAALWHGRPWLDELLAALDANRVLLAGLVAGHLPGVAYRPPDATYLAWLDCRATGLGDDPAASFLDRARVAVNPGPAFGEQGRGFVRLNFATSPEILGEAVRRMAVALA
ncbi:MAG TPA: aminotransferase class I/II-fold pyridoxal phosphate-dependent enzyme [Micromonosporaceae bacterium]|nr:aminotransferase class I/II-fold pyridoxal phosphate-dependent enzyme [Micromonosporaceae bacterium]